MTGMSHISNIYTKRSIFHLSVTWSSTSTFNRLPLMIIVYFMNLFERCKKKKKKSLDFTQWHSLCINGKHMATTVLTIPTKCKHYALNKHNIYCTGKRFSGLILAIADTGEIHIHIPTRRPGLSCRNSPNSGGRGARQQSLAFSANSVFQQCILKKRESAMGRWGSGGGGGA